MLCSESTDRVRGWSHLSVFIARTPWVSTIAESHIWPQCGAGSCTSVPRGAVTVSVFLVLPIFGIYHGLRAMSRFCGDEGEQWENSLEQ